MRCRWAMMPLASAEGNRVPVVVQLVQADEDTMREVIHRCNEVCLASAWTLEGGRLSPPTQP